LENRSRGEFENIDFQRGNKKLPVGTIYDIHERWWGRLDLFDQESVYIEWIFPVKYKIDGLVESYPLTNDEINVKLFIKTIFQLKLIISIKLLNNDLDLRKTVQENLISSFKLILSIFGMKFKENRIINGTISRSENFAEGYNYLLRFDFSCFN
jgi:hypothetical protein